MAGEPRKHWARGHSPPALHKRRVIMKDPRIESMKARLKKSDASIDRSTISPEKWKDYYGEDVGYLLQKIEGLQGENNTEQNDDE